MKNLFLKHDQLGLLSKLSTAFLVFIFGSISLAGPAEDQYSHDSMEVLRMLVAQNKTQLGNLDIQKLSKDMKTVKWSTKPSGVMAGSGDNRYTAEHLVEQKSVTVSRESLNRMPNRTRFVIFTHEGIGAAGVEDETYDKSIGIFLNSSSDEIASDPRMLPPGGLDAINKRFDKVEIRTKNPVYLKSGGGTSVGGGGDGTAIDFKIANVLFVYSLTNKFPELFTHSAVDLLLRVMDTSFELNSDPKIYKVLVEKKDDINVIRFSEERWLSGYKTPEVGGFSIDQIRMLLESLQILDSLK